MAFVHGKGTFVSLDANDLSAFTNNTALPRSADTHDVTTYGKDDHVYRGGLRDGTATISGIYDSAAGGPGAVITPLLGTNVTFIFRPEGTGPGLPERSGDCVVSTYEETSPVADMVTWSAELQLSDEFATTAQV